MKKHYLLTSILVLSATLLSSCEVIGGIFKAGVNVGVFLVLAVIAIVIYFVMKARGRD